MSLILFNFLTNNFLFEFKYFDLFFFDNNFFLKRKKKMLLKFNFISSPKPKGGN